MKQRPMLAFSALMENLNWELHQTPEHVLIPFPLQCSSQENFVFPYDPRSTGKHVPAARIKWVFWANPSRTVLAAWDGWIGKMTRAREPHPPASPQPGSKALHLLP